MSTQAARRETPPSTIPAAHFGANTSGSGLDRVAALPILALGGRDRQPHLLANRAGEEPAHGMRLPAGRFNQLLRSDASRLPQQIQDLVGLAARAGGLSFLSAFGRFLGGSGLLGRFALRLRHVAALLRARAFLLALGWVSAAGAGEVAVSSAVEIMFSPSAVITAVTSITPVRPESKAILRD